MTSVESIFLLLYIEAVIIILKDRNSLHIKIKKRKYVFCALHMVVCALGKHFRQYWHAIRFVIGLYVDWLALHLKFGRVHI